MVQGVREVFEVTDMDFSGSEDTETTGDAPKSVQGKLVLIGRNMSGLPWEESLHSALSGSQAEQVILANSEICVSHVDDEDDEAASKWEKVSI